MKKALSLALVAALAGGSVAAQAYEEGDFILRLGAATVDPDTDSAPVVLPPLSPGGDSVVLENGVDVDEDTQLSIIPVWMPADNWGVELLLATPFKHDISLDLSPVANTDIAAGSTRHLPPTLSIQWYPRGGKSGWQPYFGVGLNYTYFFDEKVDNELLGTLNQLYGITKAKLDLDDSFGLAAQLGVDFPLSEHWAINAGIWYMDIATTARIKTDAGTVKFDVDIDPLVYNLGIAYKF